MTIYYEKLKTPQWQRKRLEILNDRGFKCEICFDKGSQLHVHHKIYKKGLSPWDYPAHNYAVLCDECHKESHNIIDLFNEFIGCLDVNGFFYQKNVLAFMYAFVQMEDLCGVEHSLLHEKFDNLGLVDSDAYKLGELMYTVWNSLNDSDFENNLYHLNNKALKRIFSSLGVNFGNVGSDEDLHKIINGES